MAAHAALAALILATIFPLAGAERRRALIAWWSGKLLRILAVRARVEGERPRAAAIVAANHVAWLDIFVVLSAVPLRFIGKSEIRSWPVAGWIAARAGTIFIRRGLRRDIARINERVHEALADAQCIGFFPEGTTGDGERLLKFHSSLFEPAVANGARVYPAAIRYDAPDGTPCREVLYGELSFLESVAATIRAPGFTATLTFGAPIETMGAHRRDVARRAHAEVATLLAAAPPGTRPGTGADPPGAAR
jgi:1-acyl-sn-glycerol-3-phosphate acyltransferase